jgi:hypothetical protein
MVEDCRYGLRILERAMVGILESLTQGLNIIEKPDWMAFVERLDRAVRSGSVRELAAPNPVRCGGKSYNKLFLDTETGVVYGYVAPDPPGLPRWQKVDLLGNSEAANPAPLNGIKIGPKTVMMAHFLKQQIEALVARGLVEALPTPASALTSKDRTERWYKDRVSNVVYRLSEYYPLQGADDIRWEVAPLPDDPVSA